MFTEKNLSALPGDGTGREEMIMRLASPRAMTHPAAGGANSVGPVRGSETDHSSGWLGIASSSATTPGMEAGFMRFGIMAE
jgi:hypothetical protein